MQNIRTSLIVLLTLAIGLGVGYWLGYGNREAGEVSSAGPASGGAPATEWTCSMHPQIRQPEPGICPICEMDLIPASGLSNDNPTVLEMTEAAVKLADIGTVAVRVASGEASRDIALFGTVAVDETELRTQVSHFPGRVEQLFVNYTGQKVQKGQLLARLYAPEMIQAQQELLEALKLKDRYPEMVASARKKLQAFRVPETLISSLEAGGDIQQEVDLLADHSGVIMERKVALGDYLKAGQPVFTLAKLDQLWVVLEAYEEDLPNIRVGNRFTCTTQAAPGEVFSGVVDFIDPRVNPGTRTVKIRGRVDNKKGILKPDMFVRGAIRSATETGQSALRIPKTAVLWTGKRSVVYVRLPETAVPSFEYREVEILDESGGDYLVSGNLTAGESVVRAGAFAVDAAAQLNNRQSMMNRLIQVESGAVQPLANLPADFLKAWEGFVATYLDVKDLFVASDSASVRTAAASSLEQLRAVYPGDLPREARRLWEAEKQDIELALAGMMQSPELTIQRQQFDRLSAKIIPLAQRFPLPEQTLYVQHCPMAFNNNGADWLSVDSEIRNPYFGEKMLKCGIIKENISSK
ncbi:MAG: efflux RND transporter periplasmic adaptor subunit [Saprospiraceae bacterium]|nr:efflux RND transporter periplasmic adaptor subunit [Saprospiraceae bacterium]